MCEDWLGPDYTDEDVKLLKKYWGIMEDYRAKFGDDSLDRVLSLAYPHPSYCTREGIQNSVRDLERAIKTNKPLPQVDEEIWAKIIF